MTQFKYLEEPPQFGFIFNGIIWLLENCFHVSILNLIVKMELITNIPYWLGGSLQ